MTKWNSFLAKFHYVGALTVNESFKLLGGYVSGQPSSSMSREEKKRGEVETTRSSRYDMNQEYINSQVCAFHSNITSSDSI